MPDDKDGLKKARLVAKQQQEKLAQETLELGDQIRELVEKDNQGELSPGALKRQKVAQLNVMQAREVMRAVPLDEALEEQMGLSQHKSALGNPYQLQVNEVSHGEGRRGGDKVEQLIHFPKIRPNPRDQQLQDRLLDRSASHAYAASFQDQGSIYNRGSKGLSKHLSRETISLNSQQIRNYPSPQRAPQQLIRDQSIHYLPDRDTSQGHDDGHTNQNDSYLQSGA